MRLTMMTMVRSVRSSEGWWIIRAWTIPAQTGTTLSLAKTMLLCQAFWTNMPRFNAVKIVHTPMWSRCAAIRSAELLGKYALMEDTCV